MIRRLRHPAPTAPPHVGAVDAHRSIATPASRARRLPAAPNAPPERNVTVKGRRHRILVITQAAALQIRLATTAKRSSAAWARLLLRLDAAMSAFLVHHQRVQGRRITHFALSLVSALTVLLILGRRREVTCALLACTLAASTEEDSATIANLILLVN